MGDQQRFQAPFRLRRTGWRILIIFSAALIGAITFIDATAPDGRDPAWLAICAILVPAACLNCATFVGPLCGSTTMNATGLTTRTLLRTRAVTWREVTSLTTSRDGNLHLYRTQAHLHNGRALTLPGLVTDNAHDPTLRAHLTTLRTTWAAAQPGTSTDQPG
ncbi:PH domain-containing protein [Kitasatospora sp. LaBMicrA B282]|uniref:PH domain-containing protein n=1 Tax=Kitasatospora sp. LaBMicrA B282 TaxID=3420949 RepID=UPI003D0CCC9A